MKQIICAFLATAFLTLNIPVYAEQPNLALNAKSTLLMEASTGQVLYESNADEQLPIASVTKIMTMLLIMEAIDDGKIKLDDIVTASERAKSMGGSTMFLETGEQLSVNDMLKGIAVASANDGCVAMAEHLAGSVESFVDQMNQRAVELGMTNTHFINTNGLDADEHYSSARDVAIMSRELIKHSIIFNYTTIWTDSLRDGKFGLANTNRLIRFYPGANGLKTGSTSKAQCCLSATAFRDDMQLIAVVLGAPTSNDRFNSAKALLDYGFATYSISKQVSKDEEIGSVPISGGVVDAVAGVSRDDIAMLMSKGSKAQIEKNIILEENLSAPIEKGQVIGSVEVIIDGECNNKTDIIAAESVDKKPFFYLFKELFGKFLF